MHQLLHTHTCMQTLVTSWLARWQPIDLQYSCPAVLISAEAECCADDADKLTCPAPHAVPQGPSYMQRAPHRSSSGGAGHSWQTPDGPKQRQQRRHSQGYTEQSPGGKAASG